MDITFGSYIEDKMGYKKGTWHYHESGFSRLENLCMALGDLINDACITPMKQKGVSKKLCAPKEKKERKHPDQVYIDHNISSDEELPELLDDYGNVEKEIPQLDENYDDDLDAFGEQSIGREVERERRFQLIGDMDKFISSFEKINRPYIVINNGERMDKPNPEEMDLPKDENQTDKEIAEEFRAKEKFLKEYEARMKLPDSRTI